MDYIFGVPWKEFVAWFLSQPIYGQILIIIGIVTICVLIGILVYYVLKGVAYLIYYLFKGLYYLIKYTCIGLYKLFKAIYRAISGKPNENIKQPVMIMQQVQPVSAIPPKKHVNTIRSEATFCSECGIRFTDKMIQQLNEKGQAFCVYCGNGFTVNQAQTMTNGPANIES